MNYQDALKIGKELHDQNYAKGLGTEEYVMSGTDLRHRGVSQYTSLNDVPLDKNDYGKRAVQIIRPDDTTAIYVGDYGMSLPSYLGAKINLDNAHTIGVVIGIKHLWTGDTVVMPGA